jgi:hypothetical protein
VTGVRVTLRNASGQYWSGSSRGSGFSSTFRQWDATLDNPSGTSTGWTWAWTPRAAGTYKVIVAAVDSSGNVDNTQPNVTFVVTTNPPDLTAPETTISLPNDGATLPGGPRPMSGTASDNAAISRVELTIQDTVSSQYWTGSAWSASPTPINATLSAPNTAATNWSYTFNGGVQSTFVVTAKAFDSSNNPDASPETRTFTLAGAPDTQAPVSAVTFPANNGAAGTAPVTITGTVTDNFSVASVRVLIRNNATNQWWNGTTGTWGPSVINNAVLVTPGATASDWSYTFNAPAPGSYGLQTRGVDEAGNVGALSLWRNFTVQ